MTVVVFNFSKDNRVTNLKVLQSSDWHEYYTWKSSERNLGLVQYPYHSTYDTSYASDTVVEV